MIDNARDEREKFAELQETSNKAGADLLITDAALGLTFTSVAETAESQETRERNMGHARKAHDWVCTERKVLALTGPQNKQLDSLLRELKSRLEVLGQKF